MINSLEENDQKQPKTIWCHHKQCIFDPTMAKTAETSIFLDTTLPFDDSKQLSPVSDQVLDKSDVRIQRKWPKTWFLSKNGQILDQKRVQKMAPIFFSEQKLSLTIFKQ